MAPNTVYQPRLLAKPPYTVPVPGVDAQPGETAPRRLALAADGLHATPADNVTTTYELVRTAAALRGDANAMGSRRLISIHKESKKIKKMVDGEEREVDKEWSYFELSPYEYITYTQYETRVSQLASGLRDLGLEPHDRIHIFAATSAKWLAISHATAFQSMAIVTAYDTLGADGLRHSMVATGVKAIFLDATLLSQLAKVIGDTPAVRHVIWNDTADPADEAIVAQLKEARPGLTVLSMEELRARGEAKPVPHTPPSPADLCCIMYTSGSTGTPKGVPLKHRNVVAAVAGVSAVIQPFVGPGDGLLTYLPLAHILEFVFENSALHWGATMGYGNAKTLSDASVRNCAGDIRAFRPTVLVGVPAVWESVKKGILTKLNAASPVARSLFWGALWAKSAVLGSRLPGVAGIAGLLDAVVFRKLKEATGGRLKLCMNGGGPVAVETQRFLSMAVAPLISGYGLTETTAMCVLQNPHEWTTGALGALTAAVEVKLVDFPDAGYFATNKPNPQGEVWIRGPSVMDGYFDDPKETEAALTADGWFRSGDIGEWDANGHLKLIDRKKNLVKTQNGEYIALEKLEAIYRSTPVVANICVYVDETKSKPVAIIVPVEAELKRVAGVAGVAGETLEELVHERKVRAAVLRELQAAGKKGGLVGIELIEGVVVSDEEWTPANGLTTAATKLNRRALLDKYRQDIAAAYSGA